MGDNVMEVEHLLEVPLSTALKSATAALQGAGRIFSEDPSAESSTSIRGVVGAGFWNMNPAVVTITFESLGPAMTRVRVRGIAKKGRVFKDRAGEEAASRVAELITTETSSMRPD